MRARWSLGVLMVAVLVAHAALPSVPAAPFYVSGIDPAQSNHSNDDGPEWDEIAWVTKLPGFNSFHTRPLIIGPYIYALAANHTDEWEATGGIYRIEVETGRSELHIPITYPAWGVNRSFGDPIPLMAFGADADRIYVTAGIHTTAYDLHSGVPQWVYRHPFDVWQREFNVCKPPIITDADYIQSCKQSPQAINGPDAQDAFGDERRTRPGYYVFALDKRTALEKWVWISNAEDQADQPTSLLNDDPAEATAGPVVIGLSAPPIALIGDHLAMHNWAGGGYPFEEDDDLPGDAADDQLGTGRVDRSVLRVLQATGPDAGTVVWAAGEPPGVAGARPVEEATGSNAGWAIFHPTGGDGVVFSKTVGSDDLAPRLAALNVANGNEVWGAAIGREDLAQEAHAPAMAFDGRYLFLPTYQHIYKFDAQIGGPERQPLCSVPLIAHADGRQMHWGHYDIHLADNLLYMRADEHHPDDHNDGLHNTNDIFAIDPDDCQVRWSQSFTTQMPLRSFWAPAWAYGVSDGHMVMQSHDGDLILIGRTLGSIDARADVSSRFPPGGAPVEVDLTGTRAGSGGSATAYRAVWGDGSETDWQASPLFTHTYNDTGTHEARFYARNDAGQMSVSVVSFDVDGTPPAQLNWLQRAFSNQDRAYFILGLIITGIGALWGIILYRRRHNRLERELRAVEGLFHATKERPPECEAALRDRRTHTRRLLSERKLTEGQFAILERRIDELISLSRRGALDARFEHLPYGIVKALQRILADGVVSSFERDAFLAQLQKERHLSAREKKEVRGLVEDWFIRDEAGH